MIGEVMTGDRMPALPGRAGGARTVTAVAPGRRAPGAARPARCARPAASVAASIQERARPAVPPTHSPTSLAPSPSRRSSPTSGSWSG